MSAADAILCHLCEEEIAQKDWNIAGHRGKCANDHMDFLITLNHHPEYCCLYCDGPLLLWPKRGKLEFFCDESLQE